MQIAGIKFGVNLNRILMLFPVITASTHVGELKLGGYALTCVYLDISCVES